MKTMGTTSNVGHCKLSLFSAVKYLIGMYRKKTYHGQGREEVCIMFQMTVNHPIGSPLYHMLMKDFAITIKILKNKNKKQNTQKIIRH